jgi:hypothetical protein
MHYLGKSRVTKLNAKAGVVYPLIRPHRRAQTKLGRLPRYLRFGTATAAFNDYNGTTIAIIVNDMVNPPFCRFYSNALVKVRALDKTTTCSSLENIPDRGFET